jgi:hypothetical protein
MVEYTYIIYNFYAWTALVRRCRNSVVGLLSFAV